MEVLSKESDILTSFGPIQPFLGTFDLSKETGLCGTVVINSIVWNDDRIWVKNSDHKCKSRC